MDGQLTPAPRTGGAHTRSDAIAWLAAGLRDAGVSLVTNHPGFRSNEVQSVYHGEAAVTSVNERTAFSIAWGHAMAGCRAVTAFKNVGLNDAADPFVNSQWLRIPAAFVVMLFDDTDVEFSQIWMDARHYHTLGPAPWLEPATLAEARSFIPLACEWSEAWNGPVVLRITNALLTRGSGQPPPPSVPRAPAPRPFAREPVHRVVHPSNHQAHQKDLSARRQTAAALSWSLFQKTNPHWEHARTLTGALHLVAGSARPPANASRSRVVRLPALPVPEALLTTSRADRWIVREHGGPVVACEIARLLGSPRVEPVSSGALSPNRSYHCREDLAPVYSLLRSAPDAIVIGDVGGHTMDPARSLDACLCYGSSVAVAIGAALARPDAAVVCVTGDGAFYHSGEAALAEAAARNVSLLVIVLDNGGCKGTGGQMPSSAGIRPQPGWTFRSCRYNTASPEPALSTLRELLHTPGRRLLRFEIPF